MATKVTATKTFYFEAAHFLEGYQGACGSIHGHSYILEVTVVRKPHYNGTITKFGNDFGMVMEFADLKALVQPLIDALDHSLIVEKYVDTDKAEKQYRLGLRPTTENMAKEIFIWISNVLPHGVVLEKVKLQETRTGWVEVTSVD